MTPDQERKIDDIHDRVNQIHTTLFGVEGQEGLLRRVGALEQHKAEVSKLIAKLVGMLIVSGGIASFLGSKLALWFKIDPPLK